MNTLNPQCLRILAWLRQGPLTQLEAQTELGIGRLSAQILELRKAGHIIDTDMLTIENRYGDRCRIAQYRLRVRTQGGAA